MFVFLQFFPYSDQRRSIPVVSLFFSLLSLTDILF